MSLWVGITLGYTYSEGTRTGFVQKLSRKGMALQDMGRRTGHVHAAGDGAPDFQFLGAQRFGGTRNREDRRPSGHALLQGTSWRAHELLWRDAVLRGRCARDEITPMAYTNCGVCGAKALVGATRCPRCQTPFVSYDVKGERVPTVNCPVCGVQRPAAIGACPNCLTSTKGPSRVRLTRGLLLSGVAIAAILAVGYAVSRPAGDTPTALPPTVTEGSAADSTRVLDSAAVRLHQPVVSISLSARKPTFTGTGQRGDRLDDGRFFFNKAAAAPAPAVVVADTGRWEDAIATTRVHMRSAPSRGSARWCGRSIRGSVCASARQRPDGVPCALASIADGSIRDCSSWCRRGVPSSGRSLRPAAPASSRTRSGCARCVTVRRHSAIPSVAGRAEAPDVRGGTVARCPAPRRPPAR